MVAPPYIMPFGMKNMFCKVSKQLDKFQRQLQPFEKENNEQTRSTRHYFIIMHVNHLVAVWKVSPVFLNNLQQILELIFTLGVSLCVFLDQYATPRSALWFVTHAHLKSSKSIWKRTFLVSTSSQSYPLVLLSFYHFYNNLCHILFQCKAFRVFWILRYTK